MEETKNKTKLKINKCAYRRLSIEHQANENLRQQTHLSNLHFHKYQEQLFNRKLDHLKKSLQHIEPYVDDDDINNEQSLMTPNCFTRIQNHFRLLNFSSQTEKRLLCQAPSYYKSSKQQQQSNHLPNIPQKKKNSVAINQCIRRVSFYQSRSPTDYSCRSAINHHFSNANTLEGESFQSYLNQQIYDEHRKQIKNDERKTSLLKEIDELKHTIDDPHSTFSVLAALSRAFLFLDSGTE
jgi:hypothetical protein